MKLLLLVLSMLTVGMVHCVDIDEVLAVEEMGFEPEGLSAEERVLREQFIVRRPARFRLVHAAAKVKEEKPAVPSRQAASSTVSCTPDSYSSVGRTGSCAATNDLESQCDGQEISSSADCMAFEGYWCCYTPPNMYTTPATTSRATSGTTRTTTTQSSSRATTSYATTTPVTTTRTTSVAPTTTTATTTRTSSAAPTTAYVTSTATTTRASTTTPTTTRTTQAATTTTYATTTRATTTVPTTTTASTARTTVTVPTTTVYTTPARTSTATPPATTTTSTTTTRTTVTVPTTTVYVTASPATTTTRATTTSQPTTVSANTATTQTASPATPAAYGYPAVASVKDKAANDQVLKSGVRNRFRLIMKNPAAPITIKDKEVHVVASPVSSPIKKLGPTRHTFRLLTGSKIASPLRAVHMH